MSGLTDTMEVVAHLHLNDFFLTAHVRGQIPPPFIIGPVHDISNNVVCATSKASDQPAHTRSLIRAFANRLSILWLLSY